MADKDKVMRGIMFATIKLRKEEIARLLYQQSQGQVMIGPFAGMALRESDCGLARAAQHRSLDCRRRGQAGDDVLDHRTGEIDDAR